MEKHVKLSNNEILYYKSFGKGKCVILLPSLWVTSKSYLQLALQLSKKFNVLVPDIYRGKSKFQQNSISISDYIRWLNSFIQELKIEKYYLIGVSFSGLITVNHSLSCQGILPEKMFLISTAAIPINFSPKLYLLISGYIKLLLHNLLKREGLKANFLWIVDGVENFLRHPKQFFYEGRIAIHDYDYEINEFPMPTKLLFAHYDEFIPYKFVDDMRKIKNLEIEVIDDYHGWFFYRESKLAKIIIEFFERQKTSS